MFGKRNEVQIATFVSPPFYNPVSRRSGVGFGSGWASSCSLLRYQTLPVNNRMELWAESTASHVDVIWSLWTLHLNFWFADMKTRLIYLLAVCESSSDCNKTGLSLLVPGQHLPAVRMEDTRDICPHLDSIGEVTRDDLLLKSKVQGVLVISPFPFCCCTCFCMLALHRKCCLLLCRRGRNSFSTVVVPCTRPIKWAFVSSIWCISHWRFILLKHVTYLTHCSVSLETWI